MTNFPWYEGNFNRIKCLISLVNKSKEKENESENKEQGKGERRK